MKRNLFVSVFTLVLPVCNVISYTVVKASTPYVVSQQSQGFDEIQEQMTDLFVRANLATISLKNSKSKRNGYLIGIDTKRQKFKFYYANKQFEVLFKNVAKIDFKDDKPEIECRSKFCEDSFFHEEPPKVYNISPINLKIDNNTPTQLRSLKFISPDKMQITVFPPDDN